MSTINLFHGLSSKSIEGEFHSPLFMASSREAASHFSESGEVAVISVDKSLFIDLSEDDKPMIDYLKNVGVDIQEVPFFYCEAITHHSKHDGTNVVDLAYLPEFQAMVASQGFKGAKISDFDYNTEFNTFVLFDTQSCVVSESITPLVAEKKLVEEM